MHFDMQHRCKHAQVQVGLWQYLAPVEHAAEGTATAILNAG